MGSKQAKGTSQACTKMLPRFHYHCFSFESDIRCSHVPSTTAKPPPNLVCKNKASWKAKPCCGRSKSCQAMTLPCDLLFQKGLLTVLRELPTPSLMSFNSVKTFQRLTQLPSCKAVPLICQLPAPWSSATRLFFLAAAQKSHYWCHTWALVHVVSEVFSDRHQHGR